MKIIPVKIPHKKASKPMFVDDWDYLVLYKKRWHTVSGYPATKTSKDKTLTAHRAILWCPIGMMIDHKDGNPFNNQRSNLRVCTKSQNQWNRGKSKNNTSGFKGVTWDKRLSKWFAAIASNNHKQNIGHFDTKEEAYAAYIKFANVLHGEFKRF